MADKITDTRISKELIDSPQNFIRESADLANSYLGDVIDKRPGFWGWFTKGKHRLSGDKGTELLEIFEKSMSHKDDLTKLPNRGAFNLGLESAVNNFEHHKLPFSLLSIDLVDFKSINEELGHPEGDKALVKFAELLLNGTRLSDLPARVGGDEFIIILNDANIEDARSYLNRLTDLINEMKKDNLSDSTLQRINVRASIKEWTTGDSAEVFLRDLDKKMYEQERK